MRVYVLLSLILLLGFDCAKPRDREYALNIQNNSDKPTAFYVAALAVEHHLYPDTTLETTKPILATIQPGKTNPWYINLSFDDLFKQLPKDTLSVYFFSVDTLNKYDWSTIRDQYKVLRRYDLSLTDLKNRNFKVSYP